MKKGSRLTKSCNRDQVPISRYVTRIKTYIKRNGFRKSVKEGKSRDKIYCGNKRKTPYNYSRLGSRYECMRKGFGSGSYSEREKIIEYLEGYKKSSRRTKVPSRRTKVPSRRAKTRKVKKIKK